MRGRIEVYNVLGRRLSVLVAGDLTRHGHFLTNSAKRPLAPGTYVIVLSTADAQRHVQTFVVSGR